MRQQRQTDARILRALAESEPVPFWLDREDAPPPRPALAGDDECDLAIVGAGFTGLWAALHAKERDPGADVVVLDRGRIAGEATGRNGGFCAASLTHGVATGAEAFPAERDRLVELGLENLDGIERFITENGIACGWERTGEMDIATRPWHLEGLEEQRAAYEGTPIEHLWYDREALQAEVHSPAYLAGHWHDDAAVVDPARLAWGMARVAAARGVRFCERTEVTDLCREGARVALRTPWGTLRARRVILATNAFKPLLRRLRLHIVPVYDYVLVTEPLGAAQKEAIGWERRQGLSDAGHLFHYYRLTDDDRILWGGWDAIYHYGNRLAAELEERPRTYLELAEHFFGLFPQLEGLRFTHRWAGVIDTCSRFFAFFGTALDGRLAYALGYTGLGVGASRFGAQVALDLVGAEPTELTRLEMVRSKPLPFPPEPLRSAAIQLTRWSIGRAEADPEGDRNLWLRTLDRVGLGFDS